MTQEEEDQLVSAFAKLMPAHSPEVIRKAIKEQAEIIKDLTPAQFVGHISQVVRDLKNKQQ